MDAIETRYAGCRFRSRLEARWAVTFDTLGISWDYEPQGVRVTDRLSFGLEPDRWAYLPDFWLPDQEVWAEVKGQLDDLALRRLLSAAAHLSSNGAGGCHDSGGYDVVILGDIPRPRHDYAGDQLTVYRPTGAQIVPHTIPTPVRLHMHKGGLYASPWGFFGIENCVVGEEMADDSGNVYPVVSTLLHGLPGKNRQGITDAYVAGRSARFEHGERGR